MRYTNEMNLPQLYWDAIVNDDYDGPVANCTSLSVSGINQPVKQRILQLRHYDDIVEDISDRIWSMFGNSQHYLLSKTKSDGIVEKRFKWKISDTNISGKIDLLENGVLSDHKTTSVWHIIHNSDNFLDWQKSLNCYYFILKKNGIDIKKLQIIALLRDWSKNKAKIDKEYPQHQCLVIPIEIWPEEKQEEYIMEKITEHEKYLTYEDDEIPECSPEERWANPTTFAVKKKGAQKALRVLKTVEEAVKYMENKPGTWIEERKGVDNKCTGYCNVCQWCNYYNKIYGKKEISNGKDTNSR